MSLKKIKIQIPTVDRLLRFSIGSIVLGTIAIYLGFGWEVCVGTLCTSAVLLINIQFWIVIVKRLITIVAQQNSQGDIDSTCDVDNVDQTDQNIQILEDETVDTDKENTNSHELQSVHAVPNTKGIYVFFFLKMSFLIVLLMVCAFVFSPFCIIFSNTIIVFSLLSSSFRVI